jgi:GTP cyclohydrolase II
MALTPLQIKDLLDEGRSHACDGFGDEHVCVTIASIAELPSRFGDFQVVAFWNNRDGKEHAALVHGDVTDAENVPVRMHSECLTGDALGSLRCDCRDQLEAAMLAIGRMESGLGRGIGFVNKIRAYGLQDHGYDTVDANLALGFRDDERDYSIAAHMLHSLRVRSVRLMTNNPRKMQGLAAQGIRIVDRIPLVIPPNDHNRFYLKTKAVKSGHLLDANGKRRLAEQIDRPILEGMSESQAAEVQDK